MTFFGVDAPEAIQPIAAELALASIFHLLLLLNPFPTANFFCSIAYSVFKIVGITALFVSIRVTDLARIPLLMVLLLNEVVLIVASIRTRRLFNSIKVRSMYSYSVLFMRCFGELLVIGLMFGLAVGTQLLVCSCTMRQQGSTLAKRLNVQYQKCVHPPIYQFVANMVIPQLRAIAFIITAVAFTVSVSGWQYLLLGFKDTIGHTRHDNLSAILRDDPWKRVVRSVYSYLNVIAVGLFLFTTLMPGFYQCEHVRTIGNVNKLRYVLTVSSHSYLNAILAISQMFMADVHVRLSAVKAVEDAARDKDPHFSEQELVSPAANPSHWLHRAESAIQRRKTLRKHAQESMEMEI